MRDGGSLMRSGLALSGIVLAASMMIVSAFAHAFAGWPAQQAPLVAAGVDAKLIDSLALGWIWGSVSMLAFGVLVLLMVPGIRAGARSARLACHGVASGYLVFGIGATIASWPNVHFLLFFVLGAILSASVLAHPVPSA